MYRLFVFILLSTGIISKRICQIGDDCSDCAIAKEGDRCTEGTIQSSLYCDTKTNKIDEHKEAFLSCNFHENKLERKLCTYGEIFIDGICRSGIVRNKRQRTAGSGRVGDRCSFSTDCPAGMFCSVGSCKCLNNYVAIQDKCYIKMNPGESGCQYSEQCSAVWPGSRCEKSRCECPRSLNGIPYLQAKTRDGVVCILKAGEVDDPVPKCPLPEYDDDLLTMPVSQLRNPAMTDPDDADIELGKHVNPLQFCSSKATDYTKFVANGGGACVYSKGGKDGDGTYVADIYDCVTSDDLLNNVKISMEGIYNVSSASDGICCPSRAFTCIQPKREAKTDSSSSAYVRPRWWYNAVTGNCEKFMWDPFDETEMQSPNNFKTREHCESYCRDTCKRGPPQHSSRTIQNRNELSNNRQISTSCTSNYECTSVGSVQMCCPTVTSICSSDGGRPVDPLRTTNFDPGVKMSKSYGLTFPTSIRYYYDDEEGRCIAFTYNGALGNYNNFKSSADCEMFCVKPQCKYGTPLKVGAANQRCSSNAECPRTHECQLDRNVCCPRPQAICSQPIRLGDCKQSVRRFWYNPVTRACEIFYYSGCQGNDNNFETLLECQNTCEDITPEPQCPKGEAYKDYEGNYYFCLNSDDRDSCPVNYECYNDGYVWGCCPSKVCAENQVFVNGQCVNTVSIGEICIDQLQCPTSTVCKDGICECLDNQNYVDGICQVVCGDKEVYVNGICLPMVAIDEPCEADEQCRGGSKCVNTVCSCLVDEENVDGVCINVIVSRKVKTCPISGQIPYIDKITRRVKFCKPSSNACPSGFSCQFSKTIQRSICCGTGGSTRSINIPLRIIDTHLPTPDPDIDNTLDVNKISRPTVTTLVTGVCEKGSPYLINSRPKQCTSTPCPPNYKCTFSRSRRNYYCCTLLDPTHGCPSGNPLLFPSTGTPVQCNISPSTQCPAGYKCVRSNTTKIFQCCSTGDSSAEKPDLIDRQIISERNGAGPCSYGQVQVLRIVDEHIVKKCATSCPPHQVAVRGVCRDRYQDDSIIANSP